MPTTPKRQRLIIVLVSAAAVIVAAAGAAAVGLLTGKDDDTVTTQDQTPGSGGTTDQGGSTDPGPSAPAFAGEADYLPEPMSGQAAIDALGDNLEAVAMMNDRTAEELRELLLRDRSLHVSPQGFLFYIDTNAPTPAPSD